MTAISLSPNTQRDDVWLALKLLFQPWRWVKGEGETKVEDWFREYLGSCEMITCNSGRSALYLILRSLRIAKEDEVLLQAFTCVVVPNAILWTGAKPVYVDIERKNYNLDPIDLEKKITKKAKAVIVQNTFGIPAKIQEIKKVAKKHDLVLIEDGAHSLGGQYENSQKVGTVGQAAFFSFGRDKVVSSVFGGIAIINEKLKIKNEKIHIKIKNYQRSLKYPNIWWVFQQLLHPIFLNLLVLPFYNFFNLGKILLMLFQKLRVLSVPVYEEEKWGGQPKIFPHKFPNALAILALNQLKKLEKFNQKRRRIAKIYHERLSNSNCFNKAVYLRYPILLEDAEWVYKRAKRKGILLGRWYSNVVDPEGSDLKRACYQKGSCPVAEEVAEKILNLPTYPRMSKQQILEVVKFLTDRAEN